MSASVLASSQGITSASLSTALTNVGTPPASITAGTWELAVFNGGCDGATISTTGIISITSPGTYAIDFQLQYLLPADVESTNGVGNVLYYFVGSGFTSLPNRIVRGSAFAYMPEATGTGAGEGQEIIIAGSGIVPVVGVSPSAPGTLTPALGYPAGMSSHGGAGVFEIDAHATWINIRRVA